MAMEYERTHAAAIITEKKAKNFDKVVGEWKAKADDLHAELDACHSECRNFSAETFRLKAALDETNEQLDIVRRENKNLADEIKVPFQIGPLFNLRFEPQNDYTQLQTQYILGSSGSAWRWRQVHS